MQHEYVKESHDYLIKKGTFPAATNLFDDALDNLNSGLVEKLLSREDVKLDDYTATLVERHVETYTQCVHHEDIKKILESLQSHKFFKKVSQCKMLKWYTQCYDYDYIFLAELPKEYNAMIEHIQAQKKRTFYKSAFKLVSIFSGLFSILLLLFIADKSMVLSNIFVSTGMAVLVISMIISCNDTNCNSKSKLVQVQSDYIPLALMKVRIQCKIN